jgi:SAM-dependent methyltransferase
MNFPKEYLKLLVCPVCKRDLLPSNIKFLGNEAISGYLDCVFCGESFKIHEGIPYLIPKIFKNHPKYKEWKEKQKLGEISYLEDEKYYKKYSDIIAREFAKWANFRGIILDIGCGMWSLPAYAEDIQPPNVFIGIDPLRGRPKKFPFVIAVGEYLPFREGQFDQCICATSLDHAPDPLRIILEAKRVLKDKGEIFIWTGIFGKYKLKYKIIKFFHLIREKGFTFASKKFLEHFVDTFKKTILLSLNKPVDKLHFHYFFEKDIKNLIEKSGMKIKSKKLIDNSLFIKAQKIKILHAPVNVGGQPWIISRSERKLNYQSDCMIFRSSWLNYPSDYNLNLSRKNYIGNFLKLLIFFFRAIRRYDVFHFYYGKSILPFYLDLPILKLLGKKIFFTFQGSDIRRRGYFSKHFGVDIYKDCKELTHKKFFDIFRFLRLKIALFFANKTFVLNPDLKLISPSSELLPYANINLEEWISTKQKKQRNYLIILHAPTNRGIKGTKYLIETISRLKKEGYSVELKLVEGVEHNRVKKIYDDADIVVDQLLIGWYGGFAVEAMALGKPVVCYLNESLFHLVPWAKEIPIVNASLTTLYDKLKWLIENPQERERLGEEGRKFVEKWHNPIKIAKKIIEFYEK